MIRALRKFAATVLVATTALTLGGCATNPVTGKKELHLVSEDQEIAMGKENYLSSQQTAGGEFILDPALTAYVRGVLANITTVTERSKLPYEIVIANDSSINAWAMPGGKMAINRGLLLELSSEAELAAVLSHEVVHAAARHGARQMESGLLLGVGATLISAAARDSRYPGLADLAVGVGAGLVGLKYSRDHELEADAYGIKSMKRAGYDAAAAVKLQETFVRLAGNKQPGWFEGLLSSHPPSQERVDANRKHAQGQTPPGRLGEAEYRRATAGLRAMKPAYDAYDAGVKAMRDKKFDEAIRQAGVAIAAEPREALFYALRGKAREQTGDRRAAVGDYDEAIRRNPNYFGPWLNRGKLRVKEGRPREGEADLERSMALLPTGEAALTLGKLAYADGRKDRALKFLAPLVEAGDGDDAELQEAAQMVARLDLPANPQKYIEVTPKLVDGGFVELTLTNRSKVDVVNVRGIAVVRTGSITTLGDTPFNVYSLPAGGSAKVRLGLKPADFKAKAEHVAVRFSGAGVR